MSANEHDGVLAIARAIVSNERVDWGDIESDARTNESLVLLLRELKVVDEIARVHRTIADHPSCSDNVTEADAPVGRAWGPLRILEQIGRGAFGDVYRAWEPRLEREVALKLIRRLDRTSVFASHVIDEGRLLARVRHPNVVAVFGADCIDGRVGLWMDFVKGRTLDAVLRERGPFTAEDAVRIGVQLAGALAAVHAAGLIHRDIKVQNVMREADGRVVLMDFGTGRESWNDAPPELAGTPLYLPPEVFAGQPATTSSDVYSLGVLLFHLVSATFPVPGRSVQEIRDRHVHGDRRRLRALRPELSESFVETVERAIAPEPHARYASAAEFEAALSRCLGTSGASGVEDPPPLTSLMHRLRPWIAAAAAIVMAMATFVATSRWPLGSGSSGEGSAAGRFTAPATSPTLRRIALPDYFSVGTPSADGRLLSFSDAAGNLAVFDLITGQTRQVTENAVFSAASQYAESSVLSPDGELAAYAWFALDGRYELRVADVNEKRSRVVLRDDAIDWLMPVGWSRDGGTVLALLADHHAADVALISVADGSVRRIANVQSSHPIATSLSPDGRFVVFDGPQQEGSSARDIFITRSDGSGQTRLIADDASDVAPLWTADGRHVVFASDRSGALDLWSVPVDGDAVSGAPAMIRRNIGRMSPLGLTDDGRYYFHETVGTVDVYEAAVTAGNAHSVRRVAATHIGSNISSLWSPDGRRLIYASRRGLVRFDRRSTTLVIHDSATGERRELVPNMSSFLLRSWSPDGRLALVQGRDASGRTGTHLIDVNTALVESVLINAPNRNDFRRPDFLDDGRIAYVHSGRRLLLARDPRTRAETTLLDYGKEGMEIVGDVFGRGYRLSPDESMLAYTSRQRIGEREHRALSVRLLDGGEVRELVWVDAPELMLFQDWMPDGRSILFTRWNESGGGAVTLWRVPVAGGEPEPLGLTMEGLRDVSVHPEGGKLTFTAGWPRAEVWVMENVMGAGR